MKLLPIMVRSRSDACCWHFAPITRSFATSIGPGDANNDNRSSNESESADDFERRIFSDFTNKSPIADSFYQKLDRIEKARERNNAGFRNDHGDNYQFPDSLNDSYTTLSDGMDGKLKKAAEYFSYSDEIYDDDYAFRPDVSFNRETTYTIKDLDLTKQAVRKSAKRYEFETTTKEVLKKADFRNVRFLANFLTEAGIIIKRSKTKISATAQRKVAREIKTARAFGLMPFTTMGTKPFVFGRTMEDLDEDYDFSDYMPRRDFQPDEEAPIEEVPIEEVPIEEVPIET